MMPNDGAVRGNIDDLRDEAADGLLLGRGDIVARAELLEMNLDHDALLRRSLATSSGVWLP